MDSFQVQYRSEFIAGFEQRSSLIRQTCTTEAVIKGNQATFLVADSGGAEASTRGQNGLIPARIDNLNQFSAQLQEWHDLTRRTQFNIFASQGDGRRIMQETTMAVINRKIDQDIIAALAVATQDTGAVTTMSLNLAVYATVILGNNAVPFDGNISGLITPAAYGYMLKLPEFTNVFYVNSKPFEGAGQLVSFRWAGVNWIVHPNLPGAGTAAEKLFVYHKDAIGHAFDSASVDTAVGFDSEQAYSWARASAFMGSKLLQNNGVVVINHDGSAFAPQ